MKGSLIVLVLCTVGSAWGQQTAKSADGNMLHEYCTAVIAGKGDYASGYCFGLLDAYVQTNWALSRDFPKHCAPDGVTYEQTIKVTVKYLDDHPELLHMPAAWLISKAMAEAFPCKSKAAK